MDLSGFSLRGLGAPGVGVTDISNPYMPRPVTPGVDGLPGIVPRALTGLPPDVQRMVQAGRDQAFGNFATQQPPVMAHQPLDVERALQELSAIAQGRGMGREIRPYRPEDLRFDHIPTGGPAG
jgi:hypothetical protein